MFSSDKNIETIGQLFTELHRYAELRAELFKIEAVSKLSKLLTVLLLGAILILLLGLALWFVSMMLAAALGEWLGGQALGYAIVVAAYLLLALTVYLRRKQWIEVPLTHFLGELFLNDRPSSGEGPTPSSQRFR
ncbi:MAG: phage holin family protein [Alloprevotella sp.]|nr:phage holin family protein [Alloprevotella sp.]